ncbi:hypothetical protein TBLA_0E04410 [Henningerozyma blattae CBS 6284]|uniref:Structural maintenance of chromosomes protein n=1 Tax=Henningerozyma blattae (strain ATCC 34711 / CBS 6284 / DSM 70876 / NBRC 10599 / NRRL Y-10934 / UCD 77-7) TaxID=1071380 RepID=I2H543_HENB6|nr:hypothetical protein TBLA_0E04410 [Tetrapisispora blattae CBS 6284]CCH61495.1 hypothetical protein TBLA_0E04410 [Tetrapisispora blattae CBS 6284]
MPDSPISKKQKITESRDEDKKINNNIIINHNNRDINRSHVDDADITIGPYQGQEKHIQPQSQDRHGRSRTPRKLIVSSADHRFTMSQPNLLSADSQTPSLQHPSVSTGREHKFYSQSPPRSPHRSPVRSPKKALELIQLSPIKNNRAELQKMYELQQTQKRTIRLVIERLVLTNFKSYAGRQVVGPFHTNFSAVVGPNGSGKSNVIDSMLFVFGFRANKMRQGKLKDLIHKSEKYPELSSCSVEIHFQYVIDDPNGGPSKIDESKEKLVVMRKAFKNNSSKYYINDKESSFTQVTTLLKNEGIDLDHKRFLILQGEVENIAQMKPKSEKEGDDGLLEYLEDIIGTSHYKVQIEHNLSKVEALNEICIEKENRFNIVEKEKDSLVDGKNEALKYLANEKNLVLAKSKKYQHQLYIDNKKLTSTLAKITDAQENYDKELEKYSTISKELKNLQDEEITLNKRLNETKKYEEKLLSNQRKNNSELISTQEMIKNIEKKKDNAEKLVNTTEKSITQTNNKLETLNNQQEDYTKQIEELNEKLKIEKSKLEEIKISLKGKTEQFSNEILKNEKELEPYQIQLQEKMSQIQLLQSEISLLNENKDNLSNEIISIKKLIEEKKLSVVRMSEKITGWKQQLLEQRKEVESGDIEFNKFTKKIQEMRDKLDSHRQKANDSRTSLSNVQNKNSVLTALFKLQKSGRISGFYGRLGDLGVIDEKYDVAISTACPRLEDLVVDSVDCGQQCIDYLRKNRLGYARFILLDKLRKFNLNRIETPDNAPRLFDLIQVREDKFLPAFYSVLRDTLVATNLLHANKVAYGKRRFRVVTLDGKLIDISGTMSGGGNYVLRGLMKLGQDLPENDFEQTSPEEVQKLERELEILEKNFKVAYNSLKEMNQEILHMKEQIPATELNISKTTIEIEYCENEIKQLISQLKEKQEIHDQESNNNDEIKVADDKLQALKKEYYSLNDQTKVTKQEIEKLRQQIMDAGGIELKMQNSKVTSLVNQLKIVNSKQKNDKSAIKKNNNILKKLQNELNTTKDNSLEFKTNLENSKKKVTLLSEELAKLESDINDTQNAKEEILLNIDGNKEKAQELEEDSRNFKSFELEIKNKLDKLKDLSHHLEKQIGKLDTELNALTIREISQNLESFDERLEKYDISKNGATEDTQHTSSALNSVSNINTDTMDIDSTDNEINPGIKRLSELEINELDIESLDAEIENLEEQLEHSTANIEILEEYVRRLSEYKKRKSDLDESISEKETAKEETEVLKKKRLEEFTTGFDIISLTLKEMYQMITMGGNAELELVDSLDPFSEGVTFSVMPPKKSWRNISNLSGGEKTLSSLALVFALHKYKPTPLYVMDEIDAALDFRNVSIVANYIKERTKDAQLIVISLRNNMFELSKQLVGIYKSENMTQSATLVNNDMLNRDT